MHEIKWDGYRLMIRIEDGEVTIRTRRGHDWTDRFPTIREAAAKLSARRALIDGEAVVEVDGGKTAWWPYSEADRVRSATPSTFPVMRETHYSGNRASWALRRLKTHRSAVPPRPRR